MKTIDLIAIALVIIGAINWGLVGFFGFDLVRALLGDMTFLSRIIYAVVGLSGLYWILQWKAAPRRVASESSH